MFELFRSSDGQFFWRLKGANGETLGHSETYTTKAAAQDGITAVKRIALGAPVHDRI